MARISRLKLWGWMPFASEYVIDLPAGPIAVVARYAGNPRRSNWAGKTALIEAVRWCLFDLHRKRLDDGVINNRCDECGVEVELSELMTVRRARKRGSSTVLTVTSLDGEVRRGAAAQALVLERLCMTSADYEATVDFRQEDIESLVGMRTGERRKVISAWLRLDRWGVAAKRAAEASRQAAARLNTARGAAGAIAGTMTEVERADGVRVLAETSRKISQLRGRIEQFDDSLADMESPDALAADLLELAALREKAVELKAQLQGRPELEDQSKSAQGELVDLRSQLAIAKSRTLELSRIRLQGFDGNCPVMCAACPVADAVSSAVVQSKTLRDAAARNENAVQRALDTVMIPARQIADKLNSIERAAGVYATTVQRGKALAEKLGQKTVADVEALRASKQRGSVVRDEIAGQLEQAVRTETEWQARIAAADAAAERKARCDAELVGAETEVRVATLIAKALGSTGIPARIARAHVARLEESANELLADSHLSLEFGWERPTKEREPTCSDCGHVYIGQRDKQCPHCEVARGAKMSEELEILVDDGSGEIEDVTAKSGGARILVASALRLSASAMLRDVRNTPVAWATIDEPFGPLDAENREALAQIFCGMLGAVGLEQAFVVSHDVALLDRMPHRLVIERSEGCSTLSLEHGS